MQINLSLHFIFSLMFFNGAAGPHISRYYAALTSNVSARACCRTSPRNLSMETTVSCPFPSAQSEWQEIHSDTGGM